MIPFTILIVDDDRRNLDFEKDYFQRAGFIVETASSAKEAVSLLQMGVGRYALALVDFHMPDIMGDELISCLRRLDPQLQILSVTGDDSTEAIERNIGSGAHAVIHRSRGIAALLSIVRVFCDRYQKTTRVLGSMDIPISDKQKYIAKFGMVGASSELFQTCKLIEKYAETSDIVLIQGENGTGKEQVARALHQFSLVKTGPFVAVNCAALNEGVLESELFGHVRGAFTGAHQDRMGHFRQAQGGTLFLDEVGEIPLGLQSKLLRVIQEREVTPVGATRPIKVNVRIIAATNIDLKAAVSAGRFREDLYYRLNVLPISILALRNRKDDIEPLTQHFVGKWNRRNAASKTVLAEVLEVFKKYPWPGNVRELENTVYRTLAASDFQRITAKDLDTHLVRANSAIDLRLMTYDGLKARHQKEERDFLEAQLKEQGSISKTAARLKIAKTTLYERLKFFGLSGRTSAVGKDA